LSYFILLLQTELNTVEGHGITHKPL